MMGSTKVRWAGLAVVVVLCIAAVLVIATRGHSRSATHGATHAATHGATHPAATGAPPVAAIHWRRCELGQCGTLAVPLSYADPDGTKIELALFRLPAKDPSKRIGTILLDPGGPGLSGVQYVQQDAALAFSDRITARFDLVGWDPRGVGESDAIDCGAAVAESAELDQVPVTPAQRAAFAAGSRRFGTACKRRMGAILGNVATVDTARDMDRIRAALGERRITYIGYSYGTYLGAVYANMFPTHVRAMVLDGVSDPNQPEAQFLLTQARGLDRGMDQFFESCAKRRSCPLYSGGHPATAFAALERRVEADPLRVGTRRLGVTQFLSGVTTPLYSNDEATLARALAAAAKGNGAPLLESYDQAAGRRPNGTYSTQSSSEVAIDCLDGRGIDGLHQALALQRRFVAAAPLFGRFILYGSAACGYWPESPRPPRLPVSAAGAPPIVVIGSTGDPITPLSEAVTLAHSLRSGVLLTATTKGHTTMFGAEGTACDALGIPYLLTGKPPANGSRCVSHPSSK